MRQPSHRLACLAVAATAVLARPTLAESAAAERAPSSLELPFERVPWRGDLDGMLQRRLIRVLVVSSRTDYWVDKGAPQGIVYEAFREFEARINRKYGRARKVKVHVAFLPSRRDDLVPALVEGRGDIAAASLTVTPERRQQVDFSAPTLRGVDEIAVTGPGAPEIRTLDDLSGKPVFVRRSSSYWEHLVGLNARFAARGLPPVLLRAVPEELQDEDVLEMVHAGLVGITVVDDKRALLWAKVYPRVVLHPEIRLSEGGEFGWMMRPGSPRLQAELDAFLAEQGVRKTFGATLMKKYFGSTRFVREAASPAEVKKFDRTVALFRKYGDRYDLDHLLVMAQGYQESRLEQTMRSRVGAVGVMQVMPATGRELGVGDIHELEPNVHAGVKYLRVVIDRFYADEPMDRLNRVLFAFASYNAGPGRVATLRREARRRGLDPNVWFNNVELVAADRIGAETVTYVSNILKYYTAYRYLAEDAGERRRALEAARRPGE